jgi:FlaA1/EpsC-like NDP-sugar epimerase
VQFKTQNSKLKIQNSNYYPCLFFNSDTTGEKDFEEFFTENESLDMDRFENLGVIKNSPDFDNDKLNNFQKSIKQIKNNNIWSKKRVVELFLNMIPNFQHKESGKYLDSKM